MDHSVAEFEVLRGKIREIASSPTIVGQIDLVSVDEAALVLLAKNKFVRDWVRENYLEALNSQVLAILGRELPIHIQVAEPEVEEPAVTRRDSAPRPPSFSGLNQKYTFESFVVGSSNQFAHAASRNVSDQPAINYNPLFIYGGVGLGKTHLLNAIGHEILKKNRQLRILCVSGEKFVNELIQSLRFEKMGEFRKKFREGCDVLLVDDVQFIGGKGKSQEEFFHTFNQLHESAKQVVLTSDKVPKEIPGLEERLRSRFEWGLIADILPPDMETRVAILKKKADEDGIALEDDVALYLATHITSNVRELEGALIRANAFASLAHVPITIPFAKEVLRNVIGGVGRVLTVEHVQKVVSEFYGIRLADLTGKRRNRGFANPRQIAMYLCRKLVKASFPEIGSRFGGKDHSTVVHAVGKIERKMREDSQLREQLTSLEQTLVSP